MSEKKGQRLTEDQQHALYCILQDVESTEMLVELFENGSLTEVPAELARPAVLNRNLAEVGQVRPAADLSESLTDRAAF